MANNYDDYDYAEEKNSKSGLSKIILIVVLVLIAILLVLFLIKSINSRKENKPNNGGNSFNYENALLEAGKQYFENNYEENPTVMGDCSTVELQTLIDQGLVKSDDFSKCNTTSSYLKVCVLENGTKQYTPWFSCSDKNSENEYGELKEGTINDVIVDKTYTEFKYLPQVLKKDNLDLGKVEEMWKDDIKYSSYKTLATTKYYRYRDKLYLWDVSNKYYYTSTGETKNANEVTEYYTKSPKNGYTLSDSKTTEAYKWYTTNATKEYALGTNGSKAFSATPIGDYTYPENGKIVTMYRSRSVTGTYSPTKYYVCSKSATSDLMVYQSNVECGKGSNPDYNYQKEIIYSCVKNPTSDSVKANTVGENEMCNDYTEWSAPSSEDECDTSKKDVCQSVSKTFYNWYKLVNNGVRNYYPSGANKAEGETVYYTSAPINEAIKDESTKTTAYKWYKEDKLTTSEYTAVAPSGYSTAKKTSKYKWSDWSDWSTKNPKTSDGRDRTIETKTKIKLQEIKGTLDDSWEDLSEDYITENEMLELFRSKNYEVSALEDIINNGEIRYQIKMYIRNKKENY